MVDCVTSDEPFDRLAREQIVRDEFSADHSAALIATRFHGAAPRHVVSGHQRKDVAREEVLRLIAFGVGRALFGLTFQCIQCYYLESDPISRKGYNRLATLLGATDLGVLPMAGEAGTRAHE